MSYRSSNRFSPGFGMITLDASQSPDSYKPDFSERGMFNVATSYGSNETFNSLTELQSSGYQQLSETSISGSSLITNNGDGTYTVSSNKISINHKSMFCLKPNVRYVVIDADPKDFVIGDPDNSHLELSAIISTSGYRSNVRPTGAEDCYSFSTSFWPVPIQHTYSQSYINSSGYNDRYHQDFDLTTDNLIIIWRLL
jgi:hypothetical protein